MSDNEGWIPHDGGKIPCDGKLAVDVKFQNGIVDTHGAPAAYWLWERDSQIGYDIVFWRPHKNADGQAGYEYQKPSQESYAAGPACAAPDDDDFKALMSLGAAISLGDDSKQALALRTWMPRIQQWAKDADKKPDEALIEEIAGDAMYRNRLGDFEAASDVAVWAICEYIRRSARKEKG